MAEKLQEQISALVDDECETEEIGLALRQLIRDAELQQCWQRYHLIGDVLKGNTPPAVDARFSQKVAAAVEAEPPLAVRRAAGSRSWYKPVAGFALAASIAAVAVVVLRADGSHDMVTMSTAVTSPTSNVVAATNSSPAGNNSSTNSRLSTYLVDHNSYASLNSVYGVLPYVRMASYQIGP